MIRTVGIIGGGIMGLTLAHALTRRGLRVTIFEAGGHLGGLASTFSLPDGTVLDRFYHTILPSDTSLLNLCAEMGLADRLHFASTRTGFFHAGCVHPMNGLQDFLKFPPLGLIDRLRLGLNIGRAWSVRDWQRLEQIRMVDWLQRWSGRHVVENLWAPLLRSKFDGAYRDVPATWMWSRLTRQSGSRQAGYLQGGYLTLLKALAAGIVAKGGQIHLNQPVQEILPPSFATGLGSTSIQLHLPDRQMSFDAVVATQPTPVFARILPSSVSSLYRQRLQAQPYLGVLCVVLVMDRPLTGYWTLNITDPTVPFTGVIETTSYLPPRWVGNRHLIYLPKYLAPGSRYADLSDDALRAEWLFHAQRMFPHLRSEHILHVAVNRAKYVEPLHLLGPGGLRPALPELCTPVPGLYLANTAQIYPDLTNGESVCRHAECVAERIAMT
jgi:protoporphyrinogen oxidase